MDFTKFSGEELKSMLRNHTFTDADLECAAHLVGYKGNASQLFEDAMQTDFGSTKISNLMQKGNSIRQNNTRRNTALVGAGYNSNNNLTRRRRYAQMPGQRRRRQNDDEKMMKLFFLIVLVLAAFAKAFGRM